MRKLIINFILATDMAVHFTNIGKLNALFSTDFNEFEEKDR